MRAGPTLEVLDVDDATNDFIHANGDSFFFKNVLPALLLSLVIVAFVAFASVHYYDAWTALGGAYVFALLPICIPAFGYMRVRMRMEELFYSEIATTLNATYSLFGTFPSNGQLFSFGHDRTFEHVFTGTYQRMPFQFGSYHYTIGYDKSRQTYSYTIGDLTFPKSLPPMVCVPNSWNAGLLAVWKPKRYVPLSLEGNFNKSFTVYVPKGTEVAALEILEPNVMLRLMQDFPDTGFECSGEHLYLYGRGDLSENRDAVLKLYALLEKLSALLVPELRSFTQEAQGS